MSITRTVTLDDIEPAELAELFCQMKGEQQADFFRNIGFITAMWPGAGWCQQSYAIAGCLEFRGREVIVKLAEHVLDCDNLEATIALAKQDTTHD